MSKGPDRQMFCKRCDRAIGYVVCRAIKKVAFRKYALPLPEIGNCLARQFLIQVESASSFSMWCHQRQIQAECPESRRKNRTKILGLRLPSRGTGKREGQEQGEGGGSGGVRDP